jgi:hypothetical protein
MTEMIYRRLKAKLLDYLINYPARVRWYPVFSLELNLLRLKLYTRIAKSITGFNEICYRRDDQAEPVSIRVDAADTDLYQKIKMSLSVNGICIVSNAIPDKERVALIESKEGIVFKSKLSLSKKVDVELTRRNSSIAPTLFRIAVDISRMVYGKNFKTIFFDYQKNICNEVPEDPIPYNNTWHTDRFLPALKIIYSPFDVTKEDGPFTFIRGSHKIIEDKEARYISSMLKGDYSIFEKEATKALPEDVLECTCQQNTLIIVMTNGLHTRGRFVRPGSRSMVFIDFYSQFSKLTLLTSAIFHEKSN